MRKTLLRLAIPALVFLLVSWLWVVDFSALALALAKAVLGSVLFYVVVKYGHDEFDHIALWRENPLYGALLLLGYALIVAAAFAGS